MDDTGAALIKFCGITRPEDAREAARIGAAYVGAIFAQSPRRLDPHAAIAVFEAAGPAMKHVAVFAGGAIEDISTIAEAVGADVIQLHGDVGQAAVEALRARFAGEIWAVAALEPGAPLSAEAEDLAQAADALLLDSRVAGRSGGTGVPLDWGSLEEGVEALRTRTRIILAGGLDAENVVAAVRALRPAVVDVCSGVESSLGIKDHARMRAFAEAVRSASIEGETNTSSPKPPAER